MLDADITDVASTYAKAGASIISVLTEPSKFSGSLKIYYLQDAQHKK